jgi:predicted nuclease of predicted toxin-antitoxin system
MRFLADESCDFAIVRALRAAGHDVVAVAERLPGAEDQAVIDLAAQDERILLTEDKDFGQLIHASKERGRGVILLRYPVEARMHMAKAAVRLVSVPSEAWRFLQGESPCRVRPNQPPVPSVAVGEEGCETERTS